MARKPPLNAATRRLKSDAGIKPERAMRTGETGSCVPATSCSCNRVKSIATIATRVYDRCGSGCKNVLYINSGACGSAELGKGSQCPSPGAARFGYSGAKSVGRNTGAKMGGAARLGKRAADADGEGVGGAVGFATRARATATNEARASAQPPDAGAGVGA